MDVVFIAIAYGINLIKTLGIAELVDIGLKAFIYCGKSDVIRLIVSYFG